MDADATLDNARQQSARVLELVRRGVYAQARADDSMAQLSSARAAVQAGEANLEEARRRLGPAGDDNPAIRLGRAQLERALIDMAGTRVTAPIDGVVTNSVVTTGQYAASGHSLVTIVDVASAWIVGGPPAALAQRPQAQPLVPGLSAGVLLAAVLLVWSLEPKASGPILFSVIITLRSDGEPPGQIIRDRFLGVVLGGMVALLVTSISTLSPALPVLFVTSLAFAFPLALQAARGGRWAGMAMKTLKAMAILTGQGFSMLYDDTADQFWSRFGGVILGLSYVALALLTIVGWRALRTGLGAQHAGTAALGRDHEF